MASALGVAEGASSKQASSTKRNSTTGGRPTPPYTRESFISKVTATDTIVDTLFILGPSSESQALIVNMAEQID